VRERFTLVISVAIHLYLFWALWRLPDQPSHREDVVSIEFRTVGGGHAAAVGGGHRAAVGVVEDAAGAASAAAAAAAAAAAKVGVPNATAASNTSTVEIPATPPSHQRSHRRSHRKLNFHPISKGDVAVKVGSVTGGPIGPSTANPSSATSETLNNFSPGGTYGVMNSLGLEKYSPLMPFFQALWKKIDETVDYPEDFAKQRITGLVNVHLMLKRDGTFTGQILDLYSSHDYLKTYVLAVLVHALEEPLFRHLWLQDFQEIPIVLSFDFAVVTDHEADVSDKGSYIKNALIFHRRRFAEPLLNETIEEVYRRYVPPIIPIPGGFIIDFVRAYKMVTEFHEPTAQEKRQRRIDLLVNSLKHTVRESHLTRPSSSGN